MIAKSVVFAASLAGVIEFCCGTANAEPPPFPDLSRLTPVDATDYVVTHPNPGRPYPLIVTIFETPDHIICAFGNPAGADCTGAQFPGVPAPAGGLSQWIGTDRPLQTTGSPLSAEGVKLLPPLHSISVGGVVCGVDDSGTTACEDAQGRGFVLSPRGSGRLPHG